VPALERVWAAGDGTAFPVKFGGWRPNRPTPRRAPSPRSPTPRSSPVRSGPSCAGGCSPATATGGAGDGVVADHALWWPPGKVAGRWLAPYLAGDDDAAIIGELPESRGLPVQMDLERELLLPIA
jgi:hypothetical protein